MTLVELADAVGVPPRQIRYMIAEGCIPSALTTGRHADGYNESHLAKARRYMLLHGLGMKPAAIKVLIAFDEAVPIFQENGIELRADPANDPQNINIDETLEHIRVALTKYVSKGK